FETDEHARSGRDNVVQVGGDPWLGLDAAGEAREGRRPLPGGKMRPARAVPRSVLVDPGPAPLAGLAPAPPVLRDPAPVFGHRVEDRVGYPAGTRPRLRPRRPRRPRSPRSPRSPRRAAAFALEQPTEAPLEDLDKLGQPVR